MRKTNSQPQPYNELINTIRLLLVVCFFIPSIALAQTVYPFSSTDELNDFTTFNVNVSDLRSGHLLLQDTHSGDTQIIADDDSGILSNSSYDGGLEVILQYSDNARPASGYSARPALFLSNEHYLWESPTTYPYIAAKTHSAIDASWFDFSNNAEQNTQATVSPRDTRTYLKLLRQQKEVSAWYWHSDAWQQVGNETIPYEGAVQVGVRMFANYQDLYSVKLEQLTLNIDQDSDGLIDDIETLLGTNPAVADTDNDGKPDGIDLWPTNETQLETTRVKNRGVINTQLFRVGDYWSILVKNLSPENVTPSIVLSGLQASTLVTDPDSGNSLSSIEDGFTDTEVLPAFAARLYQFAASAYTAADPTQSIYPSTSTAWVIPGFQQTPTDPDTLATLPSVDSVKDWEVSHADISFGGGFAELNTEMKATVGYMYNQSLGFNPAQREMSLRNRAEQNGIDYEDFMLHFSEDTVVEVKNTEHSITTPLYGVPTIMGYTRNATDSGVPLLSNSGLDAGVWDNTANDGALYVYLFEAFDRLNINLSTPASDGDLLVEYPSSVDAKGIASQWQALDINDGTNNLSQDGTVSWTPPSDWQRTATYDADSQSGHYFANTMLVNGGAYNVVRLKWKNSSATPPRLEGVSLKRWLQPVNIGSTHYTIPGWDPANDSNNDGYIDDAEFTSRSNTAASARFRYESRVIPLGSMWGRSSAFCRPNLANSTLRQYLADYYAQDWSVNNQAGAYNDDFFRQLGEDSFQIVSGGQLAEYAGRVQDEAVQKTYVEDFKSTLETIKETTGSEWISANISAENLFTESERLPFISSLDAVLREDYLTPSLGLSGYFGVNKAWDNFALAAADIKSVISMHHRNGRVSKLGNTEANWAKDSESGLALYYLMNLTDNTYFHAWNSTFQYGSDNTFETPTNFWKAGVPKNYAYQPVGMLEVDIGQPESTIPMGKEAIKYMVRTQVPLSDYTVIGDSTDSVLKHAEIGESGEVSVIPSNIYYLQRSESNVVADGPAEMVLARNYNKGLVLYRTSFIGGDADFMATTSEAIELPGTYQRVATDGTLGEPITRISLAGYEGAILIKVEDNEEESAATTEDGHFRMIGNKLFDPQGNLFIPKGVNIFPWHGSESIESINGCWNFNTVRLHSWILPDTSTDQWKDHIVYVDEPLIFDPDNIGDLRTYDVRGLIESYTSRGIVVLFDVHDLLGKYFEGDPLQDYVTFITDFALKFKDNPYVWIDLQNEPGTYQGAGNADLNIPANDFSRWQTQYTAMRNAVRAVAPDMPIFASGNAWGQDTGPNWNGNELVVTEESALLSNADFIKTDPQLAGTIHVYDQWNYGDDPAARLANYFDRVQSATQSPLLIGEYGYQDNTGKATEALYTLLQQPKYQHMGRLAWTWSANDNNDLTTHSSSHGSGASINACHTQPTNLTRLGELVWQDTHSPELDSDNDGTPNQQDLDDDNDGIPDLWEVEHGLDSTDASDASGDRNNDGKSNLQEYLASITTDPIDPIEPVDPIDPVDPSDTTAPVVIAPAAMSLASKGYKTRIAIATLLQQGTANDETDGTLGIALESINGAPPVYRENMTMVLLRPGRHSLTWVATDTAGNKGVATQQLDVLPKASFKVNQSVGEAQSVMVDVVLNGPAPTYPVSIPFTISGSADMQDYQLNPAIQSITINEPEANEQPSGSIDVIVPEDNLAETKERIIFTMGDDFQNVVAGRKQRHIITIVAQNVSPTARVRVSQNGVKGNRVYQNDGDVLLTAKARDANKDSLTYRWSSQTLVDSQLDNDVSTFEIDPKAHATGWHKITLQVSDGVHQVEKHKRVKIKAGGKTSFSASQDSDGDGRFDQDETGDENGNGIVDYLEDSGLTTSQLLIGEDNPMETDPGLSFETGDAAQGLDQAVASISEAQLKAWQETESGSYQADTNHSATLILDYKIHGLEENGSTAIITLTLSAPMTSETAIRKYHSTNGWQDFVVDENNTIESAISSDGNCPTDGSLNYLVGVQAGTTCLRLTIQDGGLNDADGIANGTIVDPLAIATPNDSIETVTGTATETNTATPDSQSNVENGGGGNLSMNMLMLLLMLMGSSRIKNGLCSKTCAITYRI